MKKELVKVEDMIHVIRGHRVMLDSDLAGLYGVETRALNQAVKRNSGRFPVDFMFRLSVDEASSLRSQSVILKRGQHLKYRPCVFSEHGALMLANVLRSERAIQVSIEVVRAFVRLRKTANQQVELTRKIEELEGKYAGHDEDIKTLFDAIRQMMTVEEKLKPQIGFGRTSEEKEIGGKKVHAARR